MQVLLSTSLLIMSTTAFPFLEDPAHQESQDVIHPNQAAGKQNPKEAAHWSLKNSLHDSGAYNPEGEAGQKLGVEPAVLRERLLLVLSELRERLHPDADTHDLLGTSSLQYSSSSSLGEDFSHRLKDLLHDILQTLD